MMRPVDSMVSSAALMLLGLAIAFYAPEFELGTLELPGAGFMPCLAGIVVFVSAALGFADAAKDKRRDGEALWRIDSLFQHALILVSIFAYGALLEWGGFLFCSFLLVLGSMRFNSGESWRSSLTWAALLAIGSYVVFVMWLKVDLPRGIFQL